MLFPALATRQHSHNRTKTPTPNLKKNTCSCLCFKKSKQNFAFNFKRLNKTLKTQTFFEFSSITLMISNNSPQKDWIKSRDTIERDLFSFCFLQLSFLYKFGWKIEARSASPVQKSQAKVHKFNFSNIDRLQMSVQFTDKLPVIERRASDSPGSFKRAKIDGIHFWNRKFKSKSNFAINEFSPTSPKAHFYPFFIFLFFTVTLSLISDPWRPWLSVLSLYLST